MSMILNALARKRIKNDKVFSQIATAAVPIIDTFTSQRLSNAINAYAKMNMDINHNPNSFHADAMNEYKYFCSFPSFLFLKNCKKLYNSFTF